MSTRNKSLWLVVFCLSSLHAMQTQDAQVQAHFSAEQYGIDLWNRESVIDFYWTRVAALKRRAEDLLYSRSMEEIKALNDEVVDVMQGSSFDLNTDAFIRELLPLEDQLEKQCAQLTEEAKELEKKDAAIKDYWSKVRALKGRLCLIKNSENSQLHAQKMEQLGDLIEEARRISARSQRELHEVGFAHELAPVISSAVSLKRRLQRKHDLECLILSEEPSDLGVQKRSKSW